VSACQQAKKTAQGDKEKKIWAKRGKRGKGKRKFVTELPFSKKFKEGLTPIPAKARALPEITGKEKGGTKSDAPKRKKGRKGGSKIKEVSHSKGLQHKFAY